MAAHTTAHSNGTNKPKPGRRSSRLGGAKGSLEDNIMKFARQGNLKKIGRAAVRKQRRRGLPVTFKRGTQVIKRHPDGTEEVLASVNPVKFTPPPGVRIIGKP